MGEISIKIAIAGRVYPLTVKHEDEERVRKSARMIEDKLREFETLYSVRDKQDLLAMSALQFATQAIEAEEKSALSNLDTEKQLQELNGLLDNSLSEAS
jgi:cell division protein ZapA (FtsZ GTPase activity inhibitor)